MTYRALSYFEDMQDHNRKYHAGDIYPRHGYTPSEARIAELCGSKNRRGKAVIEPIPEPVPVQPVPEVPVVQPVPEPVEIKEDAEPAPKKRGRKRKSE